MSDDAELRRFRELRESGSRRLRNELVEAHTGLAVHIAQRYAKPGDGDDVRQVAMLGLVKAVDRFDPDVGAAFGSFAGVTIEGEIKRHFRDASWAVRVPRRAKELHLLVRHAGEELAQQLERTPTLDEIAAYLDLDRDEVVRGVAATAASTVGSIDGSQRDDDPVDAGRDPALAVDDDGFAAALDADLVEQLLAVLPEREQRIVRLRFYDELSQTEIAEIVGISQMHVSRLLRRSFEQMRSALGEAR